MSRAAGIGIADLTCHGPLQAIRIRAHDHPIRGSLGSPGLFPSNEVVSSRMGGRGVNVRRGSHV